MGYIDLSGQRFGKLFVIEKVVNKKGGHAMWLCTCDCGRTTQKESRNLINGHTKGCGYCKRKDFETIKTV